MIMLRKLINTTPILIILFVQFISAELPFSISDESIIGYDLTGKSAYFENELIIEKEFDFAKGFTVGFENLLGLGDLRISDYSDEITIGAGIGVLDFLSLGVAQKLFSSKTGIEFGIDLIAVLGYEFEKVGFSFEDESEFIYNAATDGWEYVNTLGIEQRLFGIGESTEFKLFLENELVQPIEKNAETENVLKAGPLLASEDFSFGFYYVAAISSEVAHGIEGSLIINF